MNQVQGTQMNLRDIDPEEQSDVRAITHQSHVEITFIFKE